ncbi:hypothetical protein IAU60_005200 [Kwoniella sp. DSM 27419]
MATPAPPTGVPVLHSNTPSRASASEPLPHQDNRAVDALPNELPAGDPAADKPRHKVVTRERLPGIRRPMGLKWRSSSWFITFVVTLGVIVDYLAYAIVVPVLPYRLQELGYTNVSGLVSWLLFAYAIGIGIFILPVGFIFHRYPYRRGPMVIAVLALMVAIILFMTINAYWVMVLSRFLQGAISTVIWTVGFALISENVDEKNIGRQVGFAISGVAIGNSIAPPIGGALYAHMGWHAPFIFTLIVCVVDLVLRFLVIEQKDVRALEAKCAELDAAVNASAELENGVNRTARQGSNAVVRAQGEKDEEATKSPAKELSPWEVIRALCSSARGLSCYWIIFTFGAFVGLTEPTLTLRIQEVWSKDSDFVGLVYLAAAAPTFFAGPVVGHIADKFGSEFIVFPCLLFSLPWIALLILDKSLPGFIVFFSIANTAVSAAMGPTGFEVAMATKDVEGISEIHQYAAINMAFAIASAVGSVAGGQMYDHITKGWEAVCWLLFAICAASLPIPFFYTGDRTLLDRILKRPSSTIGGSKASGVETPVDTEAGPIGLRGHSTA